MKEIIEVKYYIDKFNLSNILVPSIMNDINIKTFKKNSLVLEAGDIINTLGFLVEGKIEVNSILENGNHIIIDELFPPTIFGDIEYVAKIRATLQNLLAKENNTKILSIPFSALDSKLSNNVFFWKKLALESAVKLTKTNYSVLKKLNNKLEDIIIDLLIENHYEYHYHSLESFAKTLNVSYRNLTRVLKKLVENEIIVKENKKIKYIK